MKIEESSVRLNGQHELERRSDRRESTRSSFRDVLQGMEAAPPSDAAAAAESREKANARVQRMLQQLVAAIIEAISGEKCRCGVDDVAALPAADAGNVARSAGSANPAGTAAAGPRVRRFELQTTVFEHIEEHERTEVSGKGQVKTADGRSIDFDLSLSMCRDFECTREETRSLQIELKDPLVINFSGKATELTDSRFSFDIDADGTAESLPTLARGSGYLVLDANRDGRIGDGRELFGALSGEGFADLAKLDVDGNGWVDEADPAYSALGVWFPDGQIKPLKEAGVGALHTGSAWSPFALTDANNERRGQVWRTGVYLAEDGHAGTLQQIDLAIAPKTQAEKGAEAQTRA